MCISFRAFSRFFFLIVFAKFWTRYMILHLWFNRKKIYHYFKLTCWRSKCYYGSSRCCQSFTTSRYSYLINLNALASIILQYPWWKWRFFMKICAVRESYPNLSASKIAQIEWHFEMFEKTEDSFVESYIPLKSE